jgi:molybdopterin-containing oxidoreductase family iron-sulfur binding subunit
MTRHTLIQPNDRGRRPLEESALAINRRRALQLLASGAAFALASCGHPEEQIVPYVNLTNGMTPGLPMAFATTLALNGYGRGVIVKSMEGRPIKIDGNPRHPASLGATDVFSEASLLTLYDPDRSKSPRHGDDIRAWSSFEAALLAQMEKERPKRGAGLRLLTNRITSPSLIGQLNALLKSLPEARWYRYEPLDDDAALAGAVQAFGKPLTALPRFQDARVVLSLDDDPIGPGPQQVRFSHDFAAACRANVANDFLRLYCIEPGWSLTGANADHRLPLDPALIRNVTLMIAGELGASVASAQLPQAAERFARAAAADLKSRNGQALVLAGRRQPPEVHALSHWINNTLRAPVDFIVPVDPVSTGHVASLRSLVDDIRAGKVETLIILADNPVFDAPGDLHLGDTIASVPFSAHLAPFDNETSARCTWHLPMSHPLESWSDLRSYDGTASIVQPLIRPLYDTRTAHHVLALLTGSMAQSPYGLVRATWQQQAGAVDFNSWWRQTLQGGVVAGSMTKPMPAGSAKLPQLSPAQPNGSVSLMLSPDPSIWDGSVSNNAWLQECPKPLTKQVWGNALHVSEALGQRLKLVDGDVVRLRSSGGMLESPVLVRPGQADNCIETTIGYGRTRAGAIGDGVGFDINPLRASAMPWSINNVEVERTGRNENVLLTQHFFQLEGEARDLQPRLTLAELARSGGALLPKPQTNPPTLYPPHDNDTYAWAMVIDNSACIGCNACVVACQSENNVPIVGPNEIAVGRDMHWLRIDNYVIEGKPGFSPIPCMQCEHAPCEPVCPVAASIHDAEGLNVQVYNRCVGTRFCESNCPYKVRRFNFFGYADGEEYKNFGAESVKAVFNPDVTVRSRGVMEKCTYCVQRISGARRNAEKEQRRIHDGEVVTACQAACPTRAISFGDLSDPHSPIHALRREQRSYALLGDLGTRPRTTYLAHLSNPNEALEEKPS